MTIHTLDQAAFFIIAPITHEPAIAETGILNNTEPILQLPGCSFEDHARLIAAGRRKSQGGPFEQAMIRHIGNLADVGIPFVSAFLDEQSNGTLWFNRRNRLQMVPLHYGAACISAIDYFPPEGYITDSEFRRRPFDTHTRQVMRRGLRLLHDYNQCWRSFLPGYPLYIRGNRYMYLPEEAPGQEAPVGLYNTAFIPPIPTTTQRGEPRPPPPPPPGWEFITDTAAMRGVTPRREVDEEPRVPEDGRLAQDLVREIRLNRVTPPPPTLTAR